MCVKFGSQSVQVERITAPFAPISTLPSPHTYAVDGLQVSFKTKPGGDMVTAWDGGGMAKGAWLFP